MFETEDVEFRGDFIDIIILAILSLYNFYEAYLFVKLEKEEVLKKVDKIKSFMLVVFALTLSAVFLIRYFEFKKCSKNFRKANNDLLGVCPYYEEFDSHFD